MQTISGDANSTPMAGAVRSGNIPVNGVRLQYAESGPADGDPILFLHGYSDSWFSFSPLLPFLPPTVRAIVPSHRGHGDSDHPAGGYAVTDFANDAVAVLDALGVARATVVGHSMGSLIAQRIAIDHPERAAALVLIGSTTTVAEIGPEFEGAVRALRDPVDVGFIREFQAGTAHRPLAPAFFERVVAESCKLSAGVWQAVLDGMLANGGGEDLHRIAAPTLILWGEHDAIFGRDQQERLLARIPNAELRVYSDSGHCPNWEEPERCVGDIVSFIAATRSR
jgi:non-heme chloroperoxidase